MPVTLETIVNPTANDEIGKLLKNAKTIAVVGLSDSRLRPSHGVRLTCRATATASFP